MIPRVVGKIMSKGFTPLPVDRMKRKRTEQDHMEAMLPSKFKTSNLSPPPEIFALARRIEYDYEANV